MVGHSTLRVMDLFLKGHEDSRKGDPIKQWWLHEPQYFNGGLKPRVLFKQPPLQRKAKRKLLINVWLGPPDLRG